MTASKSAVAATALFVGGIAEPMLFEPLMGQALGGMFDGTDPASGTPWVRKSVFWPAQAAPFFGFTTLGDSVSQGTNNLVADIAAAQQSGNGPVTVVGASAGALVLDETLRYYQEHPDQAPDPADVHFVVIADGSRQDAFRAGTLFSSLSGYIYQSPPQTAYDVSVVTYQYDGFADFPDRPLNLLADVNALAGMLVLHNATYFADIANMTPTSVVTDPATGGTTTRYLIAPDQLPLVTLIPLLAPVQKQLKQIIDTGYSRNDTAPAAQPLALASAAKSPAVAQQVTTSASSLTTPAAQRSGAASARSGERLPAKAPTSAAATTSSGSGKARATVDSARATSDSAAPTKQRTAPKAHGANRHGASDSGNAK